MVKTFLVRVIHLKFHILSLIKCFFLVWLAQLFIYCKMSTQKGNIQRTRKQKYQNTHKYNNLLHDTNKKSHRIAETIFEDICGRCKDILDWKVKYKKYKVMTQPKTW